MFIHEITFPREFVVFDTANIVSSLFENCHWIVKVPLSCNLMGYLLAIKISGDGLNLSSNGF